MFKAVGAGQTCAEVRHLLGEPSLAEDLTIPDGSVWGLQDCLVYKLPAGAPVRQWIYESDGTDHFVWFASVRGEWRVTFRVSMPTFLRKG